MKMIKYTIHIPDFVSGVEPQTYEFNDLAELLAFEKESLKDDKRNLIFTCSGNDRLMVSATNKKYWWVLGYVEGIELSKYLPAFDKVYVPNQTKSKILKDITKKIKKLKEQAEEAKKVEVYSKIFAYVLEGQIDAYDKMISFVNEELRD